MARSTRLSGPRKNARSATGILPVKETWPRWPWHRIWSADFRSEMSDLQSRIEARTAKLERRNPKPERRESQVTNHKSLNHSMIQRQIWKCQDVTYGSMMLG